MLVLWLRCDVFNCIGLAFVLVYRYLRFGVRADVDVRCLLYISLLYYILYIYYIIIYYYTIIIHIISYTILFCSSPSQSSSIPSQSSSIPSQSSFSSLPFPSPIFSFKVYVSAFGYTYLYSRLIGYSDPACFIGVDG